MSRQDAALILLSLGYSDDEFQASQDGPAAVRINWHTVRPQPSETVLDAVDWSSAAQATYQKKVARVAASARVDLHSDGGAVLERAILLVFLNQLNAIRAALVPPKTALTIDQIREAMLDVIASGQAD